MGLYIMRGRIISLFVIFFYFLSSASKILEYRFGLTFGQVFYDFSENGRHAVNGLTSSVESIDGKSTDRGIYLINESKLTLPSNKIVSAMTPLTSTFSLVAWVMIMDGGQIALAHLYNGSKHFWIEMYGTPLLYYSYGYNSVNSSTGGLGSGSIGNNKWQLIISTFVSTSLTLYINGAIVSVVNLSFEYQTQKYTDYHILGYSKAFMWNYLLLDTTITPSDYFLSSSSVCLSVGGCETTCSPGIIDSDLGTGCLSIVTTTNTYSSGVSCSGICSKSCSSTVCLDDGKSTCPNGYYSFISGTPSCISAIDCATCNKTKTCLTCISSNSNPTSSFGCICHPGYYNTTRLATLNACMPCNSDCVTCNNNKKCLTCISSNSSPTSSFGCLCNLGYYNTTNLTSLNACMPCNSDCVTCNNNKTCLSCISSNSRPTSSIGCLCNPGYYNTTGLKTLNACTPCNSDCATCDQNNTCLTCIDLNSLPSLELGCQCNPGFYYDSDRICRSCKNTCKECPQNSYLQDSNCYCKIGYQKTSDLCVPKYFTACLTVDSTKVLTFTFSEDPTITLTLKNFLIFINITEDYSLLLYQSQSNVYEIFLKFTGDVLEGTYMNASILINPLYSTLNSQLRNYTHESTLPYYSYPITQAIKSVASASSSSSTASGTTAIACALVGNPASSWLLLNSIQFATYLPIGSNPLTPGIQMFLNSLVSYNIAPNFMVYFFNPDSTTPPYLQALLFGFTTSVFWINVGPNILLILIILSIYPFIYFAAKFDLGKISNILKNYLKNYRYGVFLRFWIQCYLDLGFFCLVQLRSVTFI
jgi:hypothetical protein